MFSMYASAGGGGWMSGLMIPVMALGIIGVAVVSIVRRIRSTGPRRQAAAARGEEIRQAAEAAGWSWEWRDPTLTRRWRQDPFSRGQTKTAGNVVRGQHDGWEFVAFEFGIGGENIRPRTFVVYAVTLPGDLPALQAGPGGGVFGDLFSHFFRLVRVRMGDADLDSAWKIRTRDEQFGRSLFHDRMRQLLRETGVWNWGFEESTMLSYHEGELRVADIRPRLDLMATVIGQVPNDAWRTAGSAET